MSLYTKKGKSLIFAIELHLIKAAVKVKRAYFARPFCDEWKLIGEKISREKASRITISLTFFSVEIGL